MKPVNTNNTDGHVLVCLSVYTLQTFSVEYNSVCGVCQLYILVGCLLMLYFQRNEKWLKFNYINKQVKVKCAQKRDSLKQKYKGGRLFC